MGVLGEVDVGLSFGLGGPYGEVGDQILLVAGRIEQGGGTELSEETEVGKCEGTGIGISVGLEIVGELETEIEIGIDGKIGIGMDVGIWIEFGLEFGFGVCGESLVDGRIWCELDGRSEVGGWKSVGGMTSIY